MIRSMLRRLVPRVEPVDRKPAALAPPERLIIIHNHVFKNAGTTIDWALHRNFGDGFVDHRDNKEMKEGAVYLGPYLIERPWIRALSTHHLRPPLPQIENTRCLAIMMFRHPVERVTSVYKFERLQVDATTLGAVYARDHSLGEYVLWRMRLDVPPTIRNFHVFRTLPPPARWKREVDEDDMAKATAYVNAVEMLGMVERFDESMVLFEEALRPVYPEIDLSYTTQNVGQCREEAVEERIERLKSEIGHEVYDLLVERNRMDLRLYAYAQSLFETRLSCVESLDEKLNAFKERCRRIE